MLSTAVINLLTALVIAVPSAEGVGPWSWIRSSAAQTDACAFVKHKSKPSASTEPHHQEDFLTLRK